MPQGARLLALGAQRGVSPTLRRVRCLSSAACSDLERKIRRRSWKQLVFRSASLRRNASWHNVVGLHTGLALRRNILARMRLAAPEQGLQEDREVRRRQSARFQFP
jgi:hypothetical protein